MVWAGACGRQHERRRAFKQVAQAYVDALNRAKKLDAAVAAPETFLQRIRESYPFHPSLRDIVARFKENSGYQQTWALIRILRHAVRAAWQSDESVFLIGLQHLDLNLPGAMKENGLCDGAGFLVDVAKL